MRRTIMWRLPGQIRTRPARSKSPERASCTSSGQHSSRRLANISVKPSGICCTTTMVDRKSLGICESMYWSALGPPVEIPTRSEEHTSELQSRLHLVCRLLLEKKKTTYH